MMKCLKLGIITAPGSNFAQLKGSIDFKYNVDSFGKSFLFFKSFFFNTARPRDDLVYFYYACSNHYHSVKIKPAEGLI